MEENEKQQRQQPQKLTHLLFIIISNCDYRLSQFLLLVSANCSLSFFAEPSSSRPHRPHLSSSIIKKKLTKTHSPFVGSADPKTRKPVNSKITYLFVFVFFNPAFSHKPPASLKKQKLQKLQKLQKPLP